MAVSMVNSLFPPQVETFQPAFIYNTDAKVSFSLSPFNSADQIKYLHVSLVDQRNNENAFLGMTSSYFNTVTNSGHGLVNGILVIKFPQTIEDIRSTDLIQYDRQTDISGCWRVC